MKVVHIINGLSQGGAEGALLRLLMNTSGDIEYCVISLTDEGVHGAKIRELGVQIYCLQLKRGWLGWLTFLKLRNLLKEICPDVVQTWMYHSDLLGGIISKSLGIPVVWGVRRSDTTINSVGIKTWVVIRMCALLSSVVPSKIVNCSKHSIHQHLKIGYSNKFAYIPNGFIVNDIELKVGENSKAGCNSLIRFGHAARFHPGKGHQEFLAAASKVAAKIDYANFKMAGLGVCFANLAFHKLITEEIVKNLSLLGQIPNIVPLLTEIDVFVMSSLSEGFPNVVAEAMLASVPCIVTDVGDAAEVVGDTGWVVPSNDVDALAVAMMEADSLSADQRKQRGDRARQRIIENYGVDKMVARFEYIWKNTIEGAIN